MSVLCLRASLVLRVLLLQYHYLGTEACDHVIDMLGLNEKSTVLDIGSGIGGPARYIASKVGCTVTAVELQSELSQACQTYLTVEPHCIIVP